MPQALAELPAFVTPTVLLRFLPVPVTPRTIYRWIEDGTLPKPQRQKRSIYWPREQILAFLQNAEGNRDVG
jgi:hypothetical protein